MGSQEGFEEWVMDSRRAIGTKKWYLQYFCIDLSFTLKYFRCKLFEYHIHNTTEIGMNIKLNAF